MDSAIASKRVARRRLVVAALAAASVFGGLGGIGGRDAAAQGSANDKVAAETLFDAAKKLMKDGRFAEACPKFAESLRLDSGIGTMLYLADCYEKSGRTASAWAQFREAAATAKAAGQADREKKARERAALLEPKLSRLSIDVAPGGDVVGLEVRRDGASLGKALWGTAFPQDPGEHLVEATAPGKKPWSMTVTLRPGDAIPVLALVPVLEDVPPPPVVAPVVPTLPPKLEPKVEPLKVDPPKPEPTTTIEPPKREPAKPLPRKPLPPRVQGTSGGRIFGYVATGVGLGGAAVGGVLGLVAILKSSDTTTHCKPNGVCDASGFDGRNSAVFLANASSVTLVAGSALFVTGIITMLATQSPEEASRQMLKAAPLIGTNSGGVALTGSW